MCTKKHGYSTSNKVWRCKPNRQHQAKSCSISKMAWPGPVSKKYSPLATIKMEISQRCILSFFHVLLQILIRSPPCFSLWVLLHYKASTKTSFLPWKQKQFLRSSSNQGIENCLELQAKKKKKEKKRKEKLLRVHSCLVKVQSRMHKVKQHLAANVEAMVQQQQHLLWLLVTI